MQVVPDSNVLISTMLWDGIPSKLLLLVAQGELELFSSEGIVSEVQDVLSRPKLAKRLATIGRKPADLINDLRLIVTFVYATKIPPTSRDPDDDAILGTAVSASVQVIISGDRDLLVLKQFRDIAILTPAQFLKRYYPKFHRPH